MDTLITYGLIALIVCLASFVRGTSGFGLAMVSLPFLTLFLPYQDTIVLLVFLNFLFSVFHLTRSNGTISRNNFLLTLIFGVIGVTIGVGLLKELNQNLLKAIAGIIIVLFGLTLLIGLQIKVKKKSVAFSLAALSGGILSGSASIGGSAAAVILGGADMTQKEFRYAMSVFLLVSYAYSASIISFTSFVKMSNIYMILFALPFMVLGLILGDRFAGKINRKKFRLLILCLLIASGSLISYQGIKLLI